MIYGGTLKSQEDVHDFTVHGSRWQPTTPLFCTRQLYQYNSLYLIIDKVNPPKRLHKTVRGPLCRHSHSAGQSPQWTSLSGARPELPLAKIPNVNVQPTLSSAGRCGRQFPSRLYAPDLRRRAGLLLAHHLRIELGVRLRECPRFSRMRALESSRIVDCAARRGREGRRVATPRARAAGGEARLAGGVHGRALSATRPATARTVADEDSCSGTLYDLGRLLRDHEADHKAEDGGHDDRDASR